MLSYPVSYLWNRTLARTLKVLTNNKVNRLAAQLIGAANRRRLMASSCHASSELAKSAAAVSASMHGLLGRLELRADNFTICRGSRPQHVRAVRVKSTALAL